MIGLVGGIGAGKSAAARLLEERGALILDADAIGHALLEQRPSRDRVLQRFGRDVLEPEPAEGTLAGIDRKALGRLVFEDSSARRDLERILHPRMRRTFERAMARAARRGRYRAVVLDAAVLFEAGWDDLCDTVFFLDAPRSTRLERLAASRGWSAADLAAREAAQWPLENKKERAAVVIPNLGTLEELSQAVGRAWSRLRPSTRTLPD